MNAGKSSFVGPVLTAGPVIFFADKVAHLQGKSPWVGLYRTAWFQFLIPKLGRCVYSPTSHVATHRHPSYTTAQHA